MMIAMLEMPAAEIDFDSTYQFEVTQDGEIYLWSGARPRRVGDIAVFDWQNGSNGLLTKLSPSARKFMP